MTAPAISDVLKAAGITRGDRVAVMCGNRVEFLETVLACGWMGAVVVPVNTALMAAQIEHVLRDSAACLLVAQAAFAERLPQTLPATLRQIWWVDGPAAELALGVTSQAWPAQSRSQEGAAARSSKPWCRASCPTRR